MIAASECKLIRQKIPSFAEKALAHAERPAMESHLRTCARCREVYKQFAQMQGVLENVYGATEMGTDFRVKTEKKLKALTSSMQPPVRVDAEEEDVEAVPGLVERLGGAPWWGVSLALHVLVIALASLVTMAIALPPADEMLVMVTELQPRQEVKAEEERPKPEAKSALESTHETPPTDPTSQQASDVVVPPDILAKAELGDHFETINLDRPDTQSAFGNPDAHMFHSMQGSDDAPGGGGVGGSSLDDLIGVGGSASPGSGGGWGGGHGTGIGVDRGAGKGSFGQRGGGGRRLMVKRHGGNRATESAVDKALYWLARHQEADGHWDIKKYEGGHVVSGGMGYDEGVSSLAILAFLGAGHTMKVGLFKDTVRKGVDWLIAKQQADGRFSTDRESGYDQYDVSIATLALAEAYGMTRDAKCGEAAQKGMDYIVKAQQAHGGWNHASYASTSVLGWMVMALKSAKIAGLKVPATLFENAIRRLGDISEKDASGYWGMVGYTQKGQYAYSKGLTMTAVGMTSLQFLGRGGETGTQADILIKNLPRWHPVNDVSGDPQNFYHWYYATLGIFQTGGDHWKKWNDALKETLVPNQRKGGPADGPNDVDGSWDPVTGWDPCGGRVYSTAMGALCLEVYYRYLQLTPK